jgi:hypothetical protein
MQNLSDSFSDGEKCARPVFSPAARHEDNAELQSSRRSQRAADTREPVQRQPREPICPRETSILGKVQFVAALFQLAVHELADLSFGRQDVANSCVVSYHIGAIRARSQEIPTPLYDIERLIGS